MHSKKTNLTLALLVLLATCSCAEVGHRGQQAETTCSSTVIKLSADKTTGQLVSERMLGYNVVYATTPDRAWESGVLAEGIKATKPGFLRYPGGTVNTYFHWNEPTGNGWDDAWAPDYSKPAKDPSQYTDIDEYFEILKQTGAEPLIGINCASGFVHNRLQDGLDEAVALLQHCKDNGVDVKHCYIGNEFYAKDCNGGPRTPAQYAEMINAFVPVIKKFDPEIKIVCDWHNPFKKFETEFRELLTLAGDNIDIFDIHFYNMWSDASFDKWVQRTPSGVFTGNSYIEETKRFREVAAECGHPEINLSSLEWNVGPGGKSPAPLNPDQSALVQAEQMMQFMQVGLEMACFWPLFWGGGDFSTRAFYDQKNDRLLPCADVFKVLGTFQGAELVDLPFILDKNILCIAVKDLDGLKFCFLNKNAENSEVEIAGKLVPKKAKASIESFTLTGDGHRTLSHALREKSRKENLSLDPYSLTFVRFE